MGSYVAKDIINKINNNSSESFSFKSQESVCSIGNTHVLGVVGKIEISGYLASFMKKQS